MIKKLLVGLCCAVAFCVALVGCADSNTPAGVWDFDEATLADYFGDDLTDEQKEAAKKIMFLSLDQDGSAQWVVYGEVMEGTWEESETGIVLTLDEEPYEGTIADGKLTLDDGAGGIVFVKASGTRAVPTEDEVNTAVGLLLGIDFGDVEFTSADLEEVDETVYQAAELTDLESPVTIADDEICTITATGIGVNGLDDPGYQLHVVNKSDKAIYVSTGEFTVSGSEVLVYADETVDANGELDIFLGFDASELGEDASVDALKDIVGSLVVFDDETLEEVASYEVQFD